MGAATAISASIGFQALALREIQLNCDGTERRSVSACIGDQPAIVASGAAGAVFAAGGIGLAAGGGWVLGRGRRPRRVAQVLGALALGLGVSAVIGPRLVRITGQECETVDCTVRQGVAEISVRSAGLFLITIGAAAMTTYASAKRVSIIPARFAGGGGLSLTVRW